MILRLTFVVVAEALIVTVFFASAGRVDLPWAWAVFAAHATMLLRGVVFMDRDLLRERLRPGPGARDRHLPKVAMVFVLAHLVIAGLDVGRYRWSGDVPTAVHAAGLAAYVLGLALAGWAMSVNSFFSSVVRVQTDRGHRVITTGPYRRVRHPGYAGMLTALIGGAFALGSYVSLLPAVPLIALFIWRTSMEDQHLRGNLAGYTQYSMEVRYRLIPGVW